MEIGFEGPQVPITRWPLQFVGERGAELVLFQFTYSRAVRHPSKTRTTGGRRAEWGERTRRFPTAQCNCLLSHVDLNSSKAVFRTLKHHICSYDRDGRVGMAKYDSHIECESRTPVESVTVGVHSRADGQYSTLRGQRAVRVAAEEAHDRSTVCSRSLLCLAMRPIVGGGGSAAKSLDLECRAPNADECTPSQTTR